MQLTFSIEQGVGVTVTVVVGAAAPPQFQFYRHRKPNKQNEMKFLTRLRFRRRPVTPPNPSSTLQNALVTDPTTTTPDAGNRNLDDAEQESSTSPPQPDEVNDDDCVDRSTAAAANVNVSTVVAVGERNSNTVVDRPPVDDCCPICFGGFIAPCRAPCGHWYCGGCILEYWNHVAAFRPCKCPMCSRQITRLTPQPSLYQEEDAEVCEVLKNVQQYNHLFVGGIYGFLLKILQFPLFMRRVLQAMMDPDRPAAYLGRLRLFAVFLGALYTLSPFDFLPTGRRVDVIDLFDYSAIALSFILYLVGLYLQRRRLQNVRQLAGIQP